MKNQQISRQAFLSFALTFFIAGVLAGEVFSLAKLQHFVDWKVMLALPVLLFGQVLIFFNGKVSQRRNLLWALCLLLGIARSVLAVHTPGESDVDFFAAPSGEKFEVALTGTVCDFPDVRQKSVRFTLCVGQIFDSKSVSGKSLVFAPRTENVEFGDEIRVWGSLEIPSENEEFSFKNYLAKDGIFSIVSQATVQKVSRENHGNPLLQALLQIKTGFESRLREMIPAPQSFFAAGILLGSRQSMPEEILENFRRTGLLHLLALSGFNITILILAVFWALRNFPKKVALLATVGVVIFFVLLVGAQTSIVRAAIMGLLGMLILHSGREAHPEFLLLLTSFGMIVANPKILLFDVSFQLSVAGVLGMIFFVPLLQEVALFKKIPSTLALREALVTTLSAQIVVAPLAAFHFGTFSLISFVANPLVAPLIPVAMLLSFLAGTFGFVWAALGKVLGFFAFAFLSLALEIAALAAKVPWAQIPVKIGLAVFLLWCGGTLLFFKFLQERTITKKPIALSSKKRENPHAK